MRHIAIASTVVTATHSNSMMITEMTSVIPRAATIYMPCMTSAIREIECWATIVEEVVVWIVSKDAEVPEAVTPIERAIEVVKSAECAILPVEKNV